MLLRIARLLASISRCKYTHFFQYQRLFDKVPYKRNENQSNKMCILIPYKPISLYNTILKLLILWKMIMALQDVCRLPAPVGARVSSDFWCTWLRQGRP